MKVFPIVFYCPLKAFDRQVKDIYEGLPSNFPEKGINGVF
jgi:hypothetical protein